jgi:tripartite-type tricarboxylate transporter receptor subunit TctC
MGLALLSPSATLFAADPAANSVAHYPSRPVRIITGSPGSTADITARFIGQKLSERFRQQMVIDHRAGGIVGAEIVANAPPDGHTLYITGVNTQVSAPKSSSGARSYVTRRFRRIKTTAFLCTAKFTVHDTKSI